MRKIRKSIQNENESDKVNENKIEWDKIIIIKSGILMSNFTQKLTLSDMSVLFPSN
jgi:hypothetical protein